MRIQDITLTNYRLYKGSNKISFNTDEEDKNIFLVSGENGFGKTTFLHSLLWCLYGRLMAEIDDTLRKEIANNGGYSSFLLRNLNNSARQYVESVDFDTLGRIKKSGYTNEDKDIQFNSIYSVTINFTDITIPSIPCHNITVIRSYDFIKCVESVTVLIDKKVNELSQSIGNDVFINDFILNRDIARFFFFDSERIVALAETNTAEDKRRLASAYNEVLGVKKYEDLKHNLEALRLKFRKRSSDVVSRDLLNSLLDQRDSLQIQEQSNREIIFQKQAELTILRSRDAELQERLLREGQGMTMEEFHRQKVLQETARAKETAIKANLRDFTELAPFAIVGNLLKTTVEEVTKDYNNAKATQNIANQNNLLNNIYDDLLRKLVSMSGINKDNLQKTIQDVLTQYHEEEQSLEPLLSVSREEYNEIQSIFSNLTSTYRIEFEHLADDYKKNKQTISRAQQKLSSMQASEKDDVIKQIRVMKDEIENNIKTIEGEIHTLYANQGVMEKEIASYSKQIFELSKRVSVDDSDSKKDILAEKLIVELDSFLSSLKLEKKVSLEHRLKVIMNSLMHKEDFIGSVVVNVVEEGLDIDLFTPAGTLIRKDTLSKGEQQLYATSLLKALVEESGIQFPVFIDSPLQKFDKTHSSKIITEFYPSISKQVVLFPLLHKELTESEYEMMKPRVKTAYLITNELDHSYFKTVDVEMFMNN